MSRKESVTLRELVDFMNQLFAIDPQAMEALVNNRVPCSEELADHPTVQVACGDDGCTVSLIGLLNGLFGVSADGHGYIASYLDRDGSLLGFGEWVEEEE